MTSSTPPTQATSSPSPWYSLSSEESLQILGSDGEQGLSQDQMQDRWQRFGPNELEERSSRKNWQIFVDQFTNIMLIMLMAVAVVSAILDLKNQTFPKDAIAITVIVVLNGILGYMQESRAEKALAALKRLSSPKVYVVRQGRTLEVDSRTLVPGDVMLLEAGSQVAADGRLLEAVNLQVRESALTGEAEAVLKKANLQLEAGVPLGDRLNLVFQGTDVVQGRAKVLVTQTGMQTELGRIAAMLQDVETEPTPLQRRMEQLANVLVSGSLLVVALVIIGGVWRSGWSAFESLLEVSLSMAVAVVPEGLPAVITVTLALGTQRMVRRHALIRKLPAVETLGSVTTICSDKTGTLTQNKMVVRQLQTLESPYQVTGEGYEPTGQIVLGPPGMNTPESDGSLESKPLSSEDFSHDLTLRSLFLACVVCNDAILQYEDENWIILGDPTEGALVTLGAKGGYDPESWRQSLTRLGEIPFSSERKRMTVVVQGDRPVLPGITNSQVLLLTKGSPEYILEACQQVQTSDQIKPLDMAQRQRILGQNEALASQGLRVLGFAYAPLGQEWVTGLNGRSLEAQDEQNLIWIGLVGMLDAPRLEVRGAVAQCRAAGIRPVMITGDHRLTAQVIARELGILQDGDQVVEGSALETMSPEDLQATVKHTSVYARVAPEHKLRIVQALQQQHEFVAMTGDGVNDAPALKQADIGIAMGITGTDVSKEASDMVLLDDNFATIVAATEEGRVVYTNIRRFIKYILGSNVGEVLTIAAAPLLGLSGVPLAPLQILWMNLVTDGLPALALAMEPAEPNVMQRPPFDPRESIFSRGLGWYILRIGIVFGIFTIILMVWAHQEAYSTGGNPERWKTMVFTTLCLAQMGHAIAARSYTQLTIEMNPMGNPYVWGAVAVTTILQICLIYVEPLRNFFGTHVLTAQEFVICLGASTLMFIWVEGEKLVSRLRRNAS